MIQAKIVADSLAPNGARLTTLEIVFPRYILAELNTHRLFSKNSASSRAIPFEKMVKQVQENPFIPIAWQKEHKGMQGSEYITDELEINNCKWLWESARDKAVDSAKNLNSISSVTKQLCNRLLEPFMYHKVLISATEWENFFNLRCPSYEWEYEEGTIKAKSKEEFLNMFLKRYPTNGEKDLIDELGLVDEDLQPINILAWLNLNKGQADIHMMFLAEAIYDAIKGSNPTKLADGEWHIPFSDNFDENELLKLAEKIGERGKLLNELKCKISISRCARLSYQTLGDNPEINYEKDLALYDNLSTSGHWSPFEHVAKVMNEKEFHITYGTKAENAKENGWCKNFKGFIQLRELIETKEF